MYYGAAYFHGILFRIRSVLNKQTTKRFWYSIESTLLLLFFSCIWILLVFGFRICFPVPYWKSSNLCFLCLAIACLIVWKIDCSPVHNCFSFLLQWRWSLSIHSKFIHSQILYWEKNDAKTASRLLHNTRTRQNLWVFHYEK